MPEKKKTRPLIYQESYAARAYNLCLLGLEDKHLMAAFGISSKTLDDWRQWYPEFNQAIQEGRLEADSRVARSLYERAVGYSHPDTDIKIYKGELIKTDVTKHYPPDVTACMYWLQNRTLRTDRPWRNNAAIELTGKDGGVIEVNNHLKLSTIDLSDFSESELGLLEKILPKLVQQTEKEEGETE